MGSGYAVMQIPSLRFSGGYFSIDRDFFNEVIEPLPVSLGQFSFQGITDRSFQGSFPAGTIAVNVGTPAGRFSGRIHIHTFAGANNSDQSFLGQNRSATNACALWNMLHTFLRFLTHLAFSQNRSGFPIPASTITALVFLGGNG